MKIGDICFLENLIFEENGRTIIDEHSLFSSRPCVFVGEAEDKMYFFPIIQFDSDHPNTIVIEKNEQNRLKKKSVVNITTIIEKPVAFYQTRGFISKKEVLEIYKKVLLYYRKTDSDKKEKMKAIAQEEVSKSSRRRHGHK